MKPNFALDLSHEGISLFRRGRKEWLLVGVVARRCFVVAFVDFVCTLCYLVASIG